MKLRTILLLALSAFVLVYIVKVANAQDLVDVKQLACSANQLSIPVAQPPGTTAATRVQLACVPLDGTVFVVKNGVLTITLVAPPTPTYLYDQPLSGTIDGANQNFTLPSIPSNPASLQIFRNGIKQLVGLDFVLTVPVSTTVSFFAPAQIAANPFGSVPIPGDILTANYQK